MAYRRYRDACKVSNDAVIKQWKELTAASPVANVFDAGDFDAFMKKEIPFAKIKGEWRRSLSMVVFEHQKDLCADCVLGSKHIYLYFLAELVD